MLSSRSLRKMGRSLAKNSSQCLPKLRFSHPPIFCPLHFPILSPQNFSPPPLSFASPKFFGVSSARESFSLHVLIRLLGYISCLTSINYLYHLYVRNRSSSSPRQEKKGGWKIATNFLNLSSASFFPSLENLPPDSQLTDKKQQSMLDDALFSVLFLKIPKRQSRSVNSPFRPTM